MGLRPAPVALALFAAPTLVAAQGATAGQRVFNQCRACHTVDQGGRNRFGPNLHGVFRRRAGAVDGFRYSAPMRAKAFDGLAWHAATLRAYIADLQAVVPAGSMSYAGPRNEQQLNDLIASLRQATGAR